MPSRAWPDGLHAVTMAAVVCVRAFDVASTSPSRRKICDGCQTFITRIIANMAAIDARMTATSGPMVFVTPNKTTANVTAQAPIGGSTSSDRLKPDMITTCTPDDEGHQGAQTSGHRTERVDRQAGDAGDRDDRDAK